LFSSRLFQFSWVNAPCQPGILEEEEEDADVEDDDEEFG
jgi:hypothetical protein